VKISILYHQSVALGWTILLHFADIFDFWRRGPPVTEMGFQVVNDSVYGLIGKNEKAAGQR
jgi:hypothetical protein